MKRRSTPHPITHAETVYMSRSIPSRHGWRLWFGRLVTIVVIGYVAVSMLVYLLESESPFPGSFELFILLEDWNRFAIPLIVLWIVTAHFQLMFQTLSQSANSISRERGGGTWDVLVLTSVDSNQIILGKWRAVIQRQWRRYVLLGFMRGLILLWVTWTSFYSLYVSLPNKTSFYVSQIGIALVTIGFIFVITLLNLGFTAACGVSVSDDHRSTAVALVRAFGTRSLVLVGTVLIPIGIAYLFRLYYMIGTLAGALGTAAGLALVTMLDNGLTVSYQMLTTQLFQNTSYYPGLSDFYLISSGLAILAAPLLYILLTGLVLRFAGWRAIRAGALRPRRYLTAIRVE